MFEDGSNNAPRQAAAEILGNNIKVGHAAYLINYQDRLTVYQYAMLELGYDEGWICVDSTVGLYMRMMRDSICVLS